MKVELIYLNPTNQVFHYHLVMADNATVGDAIKQSPLLVDCPELIIDELNCGIFSQKVTLEDKLNAGCRIEVYRPLHLSPMERRRLVAKKKKQK